MGLPNTYILVTEWLSILSHALMKNGCALGPMTYIGNFHFLGWSIKLGLPSQLVDIGQKPSGKLT